MAESNVTTQVVRLEPGQCIVLPSDAVMQGITQFNGGIATSECILPPPEGTATYYFESEENPAEEGDQSFCLVDLVVGTYINEFAGGCNRVALSNPITSNQDFIDTIKANPLVLELRAKQQSGDLIFWSLTVPASSPVPYFNVYFTNDSSPWDFRLYPLETDDDHYASAVAELSDPGTIQ